MNWKIADSQLEFNCLVNETLCVWLHIYARWQIAYRFRKIEWKEIRAINGTTKCTFSALFRFAEIINELYNTPYIDISLINSWSYKCYSIHIRKWSNWLKLHFIVGTHTHHHTLGFNHWPVMCCYSLSLSLLPSSSSSFSSSSVFSTCFEATSNWRLKSNSRIQQTVCATKPTAVNTQGEKKPSTKSCIKNVISFFFHFFFVRARSFDVVFGTLSFHFAYCSTQMCW